MNTNSENHSQDTTESPASTPPEKAQTETSPPQNIPKPVAPPSTDPLLHKPKKKKEKQQFSAEDELLFKTKLRSLIIKTALVVALVIYLLFANQIFAAFTKTPTDLSKVKHTLDQFPNTAPTTAFVEDITYLGGTKRDVRFYGWAFTESELNIKPGEKETQIVLTGESGSYTASCVVSIRPDVYAEQTSQHSLASSSVGFEAIFSTLPLQSGVYDVQMFVRENNEIVGLSPVITSLAIKGGSAYDTTAAPVDTVSDAEISPTILLGIDSVLPSEADPSQITINGWGLDLENARKDANTYLQITSTKNTKATYTLLRDKDRSDLQNVLSLDSNNTLVGFSKKVKLPSFFGKISEISIVFVEDGLVQICAVPYNHSLQQGATAERSPEQDPVANITDAKPVDYVLLGIDTLTRSNADDSLYNFTGWAVRLGEQPKDTRTFFCLTAPNGNTVTYPLILTEERADIINTFNIPQGLLTGFNQDFRLPPALNGISQINVFFENEDGHLSAQAPHNNTLEEIPMEGGNISISGSDSPETAVPTNSAKLGIDKLEVKDNTALFEGWAVCLDGVPSATASFLELTDAQGATTIVPLPLEGKRPDIAAVYSLPDTALVAFTLQVPLPTGFNTLTKVDVVFDCDGEFFRAAEPYMV